MNKLKKFFLRLKNLRFPFGRNLALSRFFSILAIIFFLHPTLIFAAGEYAAEYMPPPVPETSNFNGSAESSVPSSAFEIFMDAAALAAPEDDPAHPGMHDLPDSSPPSGSIWGPMWTLNDTYTIDVAFTDDTAPVWMRYTHDTQNWNWNGYTAFAPQLTITNSQSYGTNLPIAVQVCDAAWNCSTAQTSIHYGSLSAPSGSIWAPMMKLDSTPIEVNVSFTDWDSTTMYMRYTTTHRTGNMTWSAYTAYSSTLTVNESLPIGSNLPILVQVCDESWNCESAETSVHFGSWSAPSGYVYNDSMYLTSGNFDATVNFTDSDSAPLQMRYSLDANSANPTWTGYQAYANTIAISGPYIPDGGFQYWVQVCDESWNCDTAVGYASFHRMPDPDPTPTPDPGPTPAGPAALSANQGLYLPPAMISDTPEAPVCDAFGNCTYPGETAAAS